MNDRVDPGGITNFGISLRFAIGTKDLALFDIDLDGDIDAEDIRKLSVEDATEAYREYFYEKLWRIDELKDEHLAAQLFDMAVNSGSKPAVKILQAIVGCKQDGKMGNMTIGAANAFINPGIFYATGRESFYRNLVAHNYKFSKYINGWLNRVQDTRSYFKLQENVA